MQEKSKFTQSGFNDIVIRKLNLEARERERERVLCPGHCVVKFHGQLFSVKTRRH